MITLAVILPAAGQSLRFGRPKLLESLNGQPVILRSVSPFLSRRDVACIVIPTHLEKEIAAALPADPRIVFARGGESRAESVRNAMALVPPHVEFVAVHDAARPLVTTSLIDRVLAAAIESGAAGPALPVHLHIRRAEGSLPAKSNGSVARQHLFAMQTPQIMRCCDLRAALDRTHDVSRITDDLELLEAIEIHATLVVGEERNRKITTTTDLLLATILLNFESNISQV